LGRLKPLVGIFQPGFHVLEPLFPIADLGGAIAVLGNQGLILTIEGRSLIQQARSIPLKLAIFSPKALQVALQTEPLALEGFDVAQQLPRPAGNLGELGFGEPELFIGLEQALLGQVEAVLGLGLPGQGGLQRSVDLAQFSAGLILLDAGLIQFPPGPSQARLDFFEFKNARQEQQAQGGGGNQAAGHDRDEGGRLARSQVKQAEASFAHAGAEPIAHGGNRPT
jgi:hypothetical protein